MRRGGFLSAPEVARHCNADLKTIHNWVNAGKIRSYRTPGRHLRFRVEDVIEFLEEFGYPVPAVLAAQARPKVAIITLDQTTATSLRQRLRGRARLKLFDCPIQALLAIGRDEPDVVVLDAQHPDMEVATLASKLSASERPSPRVVSYFSDESDSDLVETLGDSAILTKPDAKLLTRAVVRLLADAREQRAEEKAEEAS